MADWRCAQCRAQVAPGAPRCPECPSTTFEKPEDGMTLKIDGQGALTDSAAPREHPGTGAPMTGAEHPADGTLSPEVSNDAVPVEPEPEAAPEPEAPPAPASPRPPRRTPPPGA